MPKPMTQRPPKPDGDDRPHKFVFTNEVPFRIAHDGVKVLTYKKGDVAFLTAEEAQICVAEKLGRVDPKAKLTRMLDGSPAKPAGMENGYTETEEAAND